MENPLETLDEQRNPGVAHPVFRPFDILPFEVVVEILKCELLSLSSPFNFDYKRFLLICRRIHDVTWNTPLLWSFIRVAPDQAWAALLGRVSLHLLRSKDAPMHVAFFWDGSPHNVHKWAAMKTILQPHAWRICTIWARFSNPNVGRYILFQLFEKGTPAPSSSSEATLDAAHILRKVTLTFQSWRLPTEGEFHKSCDLPQDHLSSVTHWIQVGCSPSSYASRSGFKGSLTRLELLKPAVMEYPGYLSFLSDQPNLEYLKIVFHTDTTFLKAQDCKIPERSIPLLSLKYYHITYLTGYRLCSSAFFAPLLEALDVVQVRKTFGMAEESTLLPVPSFPNLQRLRIRFGHEQLINGDIGFLSSIKHLFLSGRALQWLSLREREVNLKTMIRSILPTCFNLTTLSLQYFEPGEIRKIVEACPSLFSLEKVNINVESMGVPVKDAHPKEMKDLRAYEQEMKWLQERFNVKAWAENLYGTMSILRFTKSYSSVESYNRGLLLADEIMGSVITSDIIWPEPPEASAKWWECSS